MAKLTKAQEHDIRCKGAKTDQDLLDEYFELTEPAEQECSAFTMYNNTNYKEDLKEYKKRKSLLEKELGKKIEVERLERRLAEMEEAIENIESSLDLALSPRYWKRS